MNFIEVLLLLMLGFLLFGPKKTSEIAQQASRALADFRRATDDLQSNLMSEFKLPPEAMPNAHIDALRQTIIGELSPLLNAPAKVEAAVNGHSGAGPAA